MRREQRECHDANLADGSDRANDAQLYAVRGYRNRHRRRCYGVDNGERYGELERLSVRRGENPGGRGVWRWMPCGVDPQTPGLPGFFLLRWLLWVTEHFPILGCIVIVSV